MNINVPKFIRAYLDWCDKQDSKDEWANDLLDNELIYEDPQKAWPLILDLVNSAKTKWHLYLIAAGPLENIVNYHGKFFIDRIEKEAGKNSRFAFTILGVWPDQHLDKALYTKFSFLQEKYKKSEINLSEK